MIALAALVGLSLLQTVAPRPLLLVHIMPWFESGAKGLGWHWTMNWPAQGSPPKAPLASHFEPKIGPYDLLDPDLIELQVGWIKLSGFDCLLADWYGERDWLDYAMIHKRTEALFEVAARAGLKIGVVYEDQTVKHALEQHLIQPPEAPDVAQRTGKFLNDTWFPSPAWLRLGGEPAVLVFGPQHFDAALWGAFRSGTGPMKLLTLHERRPFADGAFDWPIPDRGLKQLDIFQQAVGRDSLRIGSAYPRFKDIYAQRGQKGYAEIPDNDGKTYAETLDRALKAGYEAVQVATWNDWQEGTQIEPSKEFGYRDLIATQVARKKVDPDFRFIAADLDLPFRLYNLRKAQPKSATLDRVRDAIFKGDTSTAKKLLDEVERSSAISQTPPERSTTPARPLRKPQTPARAGGRF